MDEASIPTLDQLKERIETELIPLAESIKFDGQSATQLVPILLYCAILESAWSTLLLSKHGMKMQAYLVLRSLVELVVEFEGIVEDEKRIRDFLIRSEKNVLKTLRRAKGGNPFFQKIGQLPDIDERIKAKEKEIKSIRSEGGDSTMLKQRFEAIGAISDYEGLYHKLSDEAHYSFFALTSRFAEIESKEVRFRAFHHEGEESFDALRCAVAELLEKSLQALSRRFLIVQ